MSSDPARPAVSVIVPARDAADTLQRTLATLGAQRLSRPYEVIVVDAGSTDATPDIAGRAGAAVRVLSIGPAGPAEARNRGAAVARGDALAFTDSDCFPAEDWLEQGLRALEGASLVQGRVRPDPHAHPGPFDRFVSVEGEWGLYESANLFVCRSAFEAAGGFEAWLVPTIGPPHMGEDIDFAWRVRREGGRTRFCAEAVVDHAVFPRGAWAFVLEYRRRRYFPDIAKRVPELRRQFLVARLFLSRRTAAFDVALVGLVAAAGTREPLALVALAPYALELATGARPWGHYAPKVAAVHAVADAVGCWSLVLGTLRTRSPVL